MSRTGRKTPARERESPDKSSHSFRLGKIEGKTHAERSAHDDQQVDLFPIFDQAVIKLVRERFAVAVSFRSVALSRGDGAEVR